MEDSDGILILKSSVTYLTISTIQLPLYFINLLPPCLRTIYWKRYLKRRLREIEASEEVQSYPITPFYQLANTGVSELRINSKLHPI